MTFLDRVSDINQPETHLEDMMPNQLTHQTVVHQEDTMPNQSVPHEVDGESEGASFGTESTLVAIAISEQ